jgi:hypothetical protein
VGLFTVLIYALPLSPLSLGVLPWRVIAANEGDLIATLASHTIPMLRCSPADPLRMRTTLILIRPNQAAPAADLTSLDTILSHMIGILIPH